MAAATPVVDDIRQAAHAIPAGLRHWGPRWGDDILRSRDAMLALYEPLLRACDVRRHQVAHGLPYGPHERQVIDVFASGQARNAPMLVFVHGGAFVRGERDLNAHVHANVAAEFAAGGYVAANIGYRLAPDATWPEGARDVLAAMAWLRRHAARFGGDPGRMFLMGHSAGCAHCATAAWNAHIGSGSSPDLAGLILVSPRLRIDLASSNPNRDGVRAYYGAEPAEHAGRAPLDHVSWGTPIFLASAGFENPGLHRDVDELVSKTKALPQDVHRLTHLHLPEHNHVSIVAQFNTPFNPLGQAVRQWCERAAPA